MKAGSKIDLNFRAVKKVAAQLQKLGCENVTVVYGGGRSMPLIYVGHLRLIVRVAKMCGTLRTVTVGGKKYSYPYSCWVFNLHHKGEKIEGVDGVFCVLYRKREFYCVPFSEIQGSNICIHKSTRRKQYGGRHAQFRNSVRWLLEAA